MPYGGSGHKMSGTQELGSSYASFSEERCRRNNRPHGDLDHRFVDFLVAVSNESSEPFRIELYGGRMGRASAYSLGPLATYRRFWGRFVGDSALECLSRFALAAHDGEEFAHQV